MMNERIPVFETERAIKRQQEEEAERLAILEHEAMVKELTESFQEMLYDINNPEYKQCGCIGHPSEE